MADSSSSGSESVPPPPPPSLRIRARDRARTILLGSPALGLREGLRARLRAPVMVRLRDKLSFTSGVAGMCATVAVLARWPQLFWLWFAAWSVPLMLWRIVSYCREEKGYYLADFCYIVNFLCFAHLFLLPRSPALFQAAFMSACGPVAWAIVAWRNSLVFHDVEKLSSVFIHIMPMLLMFCQRWGYAGGPAAPPSLAAPPPPPPAYLACDAAGVGPCASSYARAMAVPLAFYAAWQLGYVLKTEVLDRRHLDANPQLQTSLRYIAGAGKGALHDALAAIARGLGLLRAGERLDPAAAVTKAAFVAAQLLFTMLTLLPTWLMYNSLHAHLAALVFFALAATHNGSVYYIEVFSRRYMANIEKAIAQTAETQASALTSVVEAAMRGGGDAGAAAAAAMPVAPPPLAPAGAAPDAAAAASHSTGALLRRLGSRMLTGLTTEAGGLDLGGLLGASPEPPSTMSGSSSSAGSRASSGGGAGASGSDGEGTGADSSCEVSPSAAGAAAALPQAAAPVAGRDTAVPAEAVAAQ